MTTFSEHLTRWNLLPDGEPILTCTGGLLPVLAGGTPAMLKIATGERGGHRVLRWWDAQGAARVITHDADAILMERAQGSCSLADLARNGRDDDASRIVCGVVAALHAPRPQPPADLPALAAWFAPLRRAAGVHGGAWRVAGAVAAELLASPRDVTVLHGDVHHGNILDFGARGWLAVDPKGLIGERGFDYANLFCNPDAAVATKPGRLARQLDTVAVAANLERSRLLQWVVAWTGLSAAFDLEDNVAPGCSLAVAELAGAELRG